VRRSAGSIEMQIAQKFSGSSNSGKFILAFNDNKELAATIDPVQLSDAAEQYQFLSHGGYTENNGRLIASFLRCF
jgi:hypothetical protein